MSASDGEAAPERPSAVDCVVSDYDMPGTDGLALLAAVRERCPGLPFVPFTAEGSEAIGGDAIAAGRRRLRHQGREVRPV